METEHHTQSNEPGLKQETNEMNLLSIKLDADNELGLQRNFKRQSVFVINPIISRASSKEVDKLFIDPEDIKEDSVDSNQLSFDEDEDYLTSSEVSETDGQVKESEAEVFVRRRHSKKDNSIKAARANRLRELTLGLSTSPYDINYPHMKLLIKNHKDLTVRVLAKFREIDNNEYKVFIQRMVYDEGVQRVFNQFYLLNHKYAECALVFLLNSYEEAGICHLFQSFYLEFDANNDNRMQAQELERCIEYLAKESFIGREKMIITLKEIGVYCNDNLSFFQEKVENSKVLNSETVTKMFEKFKNIDIRKKINKKMEFVDFHKLAPIISIFFFEYIIKIFLKKRDAYQFHLGLPYKSNKKGKHVYDSSQEPTGLFRAFVKELHGETDIQKPVVTIQVVIKALLLYRSSGFSEILPMEGVERIIKDIKELMGVDQLTQKEKRKYTIKEILPLIAAKICTEISWNTSNTEKSIENYDQMVYWLGGALCTNLKKKKLDKMLKEAFLYLPYPTFEQFVKGLDYILHRIIPTIVSPAAIYIAKNLMKTPEAVIINEDILGNSTTRFDIDYIIEQDNLFQRIYYFSIRFQVKLVYVRLLYKHHYSTYRREMEINRTVHEYNEIIQNPGLFEDAIPGNFGNFTDSNLTIIKIKEINEDEEEETRKEMKIRRFFETLAHKELISKQRRTNKRFGPTAPILKHLNTFDKRKKKANKLSRTKQLQAEANLIDFKINDKELEKRKILNKVKESSAFPNTSDITPDILMNFLKSANSNSIIVKKLERFIYRENEKINFQDIHKFLVSEELKRINKEAPEDLLKSKTKYMMKNLQEDIRDKEICEDDLRAEDFEEKYFKEVARRRSAVMKLNEMNEAPIGIQTRIRGCCCIVY